MVSADTDRAEWRVALRRGGHAVCGPGGHRYATNRTGGGVCVCCGDTIAPEEL